VFEARAMMSTPPADLEPEIDRLYQLPLDEFVQARNELAGRARSDGHAEVALQVQALAKPSVSAWAVNQLHWRARREFDALMQTGQKLRAAQEATLRGRGTDVRDARKQRDAALVAALERTLDLLLQSGHPVTPAMRLRIATDLDALAAYGGTPPGTVAGRLVQDLEPPGFEVFAGLQAGATRTGKAEPDQRRPHRRAGAEVVSFEAIANARRAVADAERVAGERRAEAHRAASALEHARDEVKAAQAEAARARTAWEEAQRKVEQAERQVPEREQHVERARRAAEEAIDALERARRALEAVKRKK
jgi:hypothetical protein